VAAYGERSRKGVELAVEEVNGDGGINGQPLEVIYEDAKSSPKDGVSAIKELISADDVGIVVGDVLSSTTLAMAPIAERDEVILLAPGASIPSLRDAGDYIFRNWASDDYDGKAMASYAQKMEHIESIANVASLAETSCL